METDLKVQVEVVKLEFGKLELKPGDILVIRTQFPMSMANKERLRDEVNKGIPEGVKVWLLDQDVELGVISPAGLMTKDEARILDNCVLPEEVQKLRRQGGHLG